VQAHTHTHRKNSEADRTKAQSIPNPEFPSPILRKLTQVIVHTKCSGISMLSPPLGAGGATTARKFGSGAAEGGEGSENR